MNQEVKGSIRAKKATLLGPVVWTQQTYLRLLKTEVFRVLLGLLLPDYHQKKRKCKNE